MSNPDGSEHGPRDPKRELDDLLKEIDEVLDENAEEFVRSYVLRGGQGWSGFFNPSFFVGAATASLVAGISWDVFKVAMARAVHAVRRVPGHSIEDSVREDGSVEPGFEYVLYEAWEVARGLRTDNPVGHSVDTATALHWSVFFLELERANAFVRLSPEHFARLAAAAAATPERLSPSQLVARIVDRWLRDNPSAHLGIQS